MLRVGCENEWSVIKALCDFVIVFYDFVKNGLSPRYNIWFHFLCGEESG